MPKLTDKRKPETIIAAMQRQLRLTEEYAREGNDARLRHVQGEHEYRARATKAEQECAEWKRRFDALLAAIPELRKVGA